MLGLLNFTHFVQSGGLAAIFILSVLQSCCVPTSSELTLGFAGVLAGTGKLNLPSVILVAVAGELVGAVIAWTIGRYGGRAFVDRYGKYVLVTRHDLDRAEDWFRRRGRWGVLVSRLLPVIRNFVALIGGVAEVPFVTFVVLTAIGSLIWCSAMTGIGYGVGSHYEKIMHGVSYAGYIIAVIVVAAVVFVVWHRWRSYRAHAGVVGADGAAMGAEEVGVGATGTGSKYRPQHRAGQRRD